MFIIKETKIVKKMISVKKLTGIIFILLRMSENKRPLYGHICFCLLI